MRIGIVHDDLDGIGCAVVLKVCVNVDKIVFASPHNIDRVLAEWIGRAERIYVADIGINPGTLDRVLKIVEKARDVGTQVIWIDHHRWDTEWIDKLRSLGVELYVDRSTCAAGLCLSKLCSDASRDLKAFIDDVCSVDLWRFSTPLSPYIYRYAMYRDSERWRSKCIEVFLKVVEKSYRSILNVVEPIVEKYIDRELKVLSSIEKTIRVINVCGRSIALYFRHSDIPNQSLVGNRILSLGYDIAILVSKRGASLSLRSRTVDVSKLARYLGGGGHERAAGAPLKINPFIRLLYRVPFIRRIAENIILSKLSKILADACRDGVLS